MSTNFVRNAEGIVVCACGCEEQFIEGEPVAYTTEVITVYNTGQPDNSGNFTIYKLKHLAKLNEPEILNESFFKQKLTDLYYLGTLNTRRSVVRIYKYCHNTLRISMIDDD